MPKSLEPLASDTGGLVAEDGTAREDSETAPRIVLLPAEPAEQEPTVHESAEQVSAEQEPTELALPGAAEPLPDDEQDPILQFVGVASSVTSPFGFNGGHWYARISVDF